MSTKDEDRNLSRDLTKRVQELTTLNVATRILQDDGKSTRELLDELVVIVPSATCLPAHTGARIRLGEVEAATPNFANASLIMQVDFATAEGQPGSIEIGGIESQRSDGEGPLFNEGLVQTLADMLRTAIDRRQVEKALRESEEGCRQLTEKGYEMGYHISRPHGQVRRILARGIPIEDESERVYRFAGDAENTTQRRLADKKLRSREQFYRALIENSSDAIALFGRDGSILFASPSTPQILGFSPEELVRYSAFELVDPDHKALLAKNMSELAKNPGASITMEARVRHKDGSWRWLEGTLTNLLEEVSVGAIVNNYRDITERKHAEEQLRRTTEELRALSENILSAREQEGTRIAREIHDELGSALTSLKWDLEGIEKTLSTSRDQIQLTSLRNRIKEMTRLMDTTINVVRRIASELRPSVLDDLGLGEALEWHAQQFQERSRITCKCDSSLHDLDLTQEQATAVFRIFQEVLTNVLRHSQATQVRFVMQKDGEEFLLTVTDNGRGITNEEKSGRSLGLLGMRERAYLIGGTVDILGIKGKGTVVTVRVPVLSQKS